MAETTDNEIQDNDIIVDSETGLQICTICGQFKQKRFSLPGFGNKKPTEMTVHIECDCERKKRENAEKEEARLEHERKVNAAKLKCFPASGFYADCTFDVDDGRNQNQSNICKRYAETFVKKDPYGLLLYGKTGTGKSFMSSAIANAVIDRGFSAHQTDIGYITNVLQSSISNRQQNLYRILDCDLLLIEDLGAQRSTEYMMENIYTVIDGRYKSGKPMIITTNFDYDEMQNVTDTNPWCRIFDRIIERCYPIEFKGVSHRKIKTQQMYMDMHKRLGIS